MDYSNNVPYPELYYNLTPIIDDYINSHLDGFTNEYSNENFEKMVDDIYNELMDKYPEIEDDKDHSKVSQYGRPYYNRGRLFRDFISLILLRRLFGRRGRYGPGYGGRRRPGYGRPGYGGGYGPGYGGGYGPGYGGGYGPGYGGGYGPGKGNGPGFGY